MPLVRKPTPSPEHGKSTLASVVSGLGSTDPEVRWRAARAAAEVPESAAALAAVLPTEADFHIREAMFTSLARIATRESIAGIVPLLRSSDAALRTGALDALRTSVIATHELLPQLLKDADVDVRILSCELARSLPGEEATRQLCALLAEEPDVNVCAAAIEVLAEVGNHTALPALAHCGQRFPQAPFLGFAIKAAMDRITSAGDRG